MSKWCFNYDSGEYEDIDKDGYSWTQGEYVYNWDDSEYRRDEELQRSLDEDDNWQNTFSHTVTSRKSVYHIFQFLGYPETL